MADEKQVKRISRDLIITGNLKEKILQDALDILPLYEDVEEYNSFLPAHEEGRKDMFDPLDIMGVENIDLIEIGIDYLEFTIYTDNEKAMKIYSLIFMDEIGELNFEGQTRLYEKRYLGANGFTLLTDPKNKSCRYHIRFIVPGQACKLIRLENLENLLYIRDKEGILMNCTRIDLRADGCPFTPLEVYEAIKEGKADTRATRDMLKKFEQPFENRENGKIGTEGMTLGSRKSERFLRIYNLHGPTRFELECKGEAANLYFNRLINRRKDFNEITMGIFQDFIRIDADFWRKFVKDYKRTYMKIGKYEDQTKARLEKYLYKQAAAAIGILYLINGENWMRKLAGYGIKQAKQNRKYAPILHAYGLTDD